MKQKRNLNKEAVLAAAAALAQEVGLCNVTLNRLAQTLQIKPPSLYTYFDGIADLYAALTILTMQRLENAIRNAAVGKAKADALLSIAIAYRRFAKENPELYKTILHLPATQRDDVKEAGYAVVCVFNRVVEGYQFSEKQSFHFVRALRSAIHGFVALEEAGYFTTPIDLDESFETMIRGIILAQELPA